MEEEVVLCAASAYEQKFYLNPQFESLPEAVRQELQIMCVLYTEDVGGILLVVYDEEGNLELKVEPKNCFRSTANPMVVRKSRVKSRARRK